MSSEHGWIDPQSVASVALGDGLQMPAIGLGTFGSDTYGAGEVAGAVQQALEVGYRHIDCAAVYANEAEIGQVLNAAIDRNLAREELWITSKLWNDMHDKVEHACERSLRDLNLDYLDAYLVHWPFANHHPPGCDIDERNPDARPFEIGRYLDTWGAMERLVERGLCRAIGTSNMTVAKMDALLGACRIRPALNQMELHPHLQQRELFDYLVQQEIQPVGYCPIGSPNRPERDRTPGDTVDTSDPVIVEIANRLGVHPALVCISWSIQRGSVPIPFSVKRAQIEANLRIAVEQPLTGVDMERISEIERGCRLIKGQVFLWEGAESWEDLWD